MIVKSLLEWKKIETYYEAILGDFAKGDGVRFSITHNPTCYRRGQWRLLIEVSMGENHLKWGCFDDADQPTRWYHSFERATAEAEDIARVLKADRYQ